MADVRIEGEREMERAFYGLLDTTQRKVLDKAVKAGADIVLADAKAGAARISPHIAKVVNRKKLRRLHRYESGYSVNITPKNPPLVDRAINKATEWGNALARGGYALLALFFEYGTSKLSARPFLSTAYESQKQAAEKAITRTLNEGIQKAAREEGVRL